MADKTEILRRIKDEGVKFVDLRFSDPRGKMQHVTMDASAFDDDSFSDGIMFDGSSIAGWKDISQSDMTLMPDAQSAYVDPFFAQSTMVLFCDIFEPTTGERYERDARGTARKAEAYLEQTGVGDKAFFGPEPEFFIFDDVRFARGSLQLRVQAGQHGAAHEHGHRVRDGEPRPPSAHQGRLFPGPAGG